jgi:LacI family transcriptional regulator
VKKATIKDIARDLNVSVGTVYRALNNKGRISDRTKKRVLERAKELNYTANSVARKFALHSSYRILVVMPEEPAFYWDDIRSGLADAESELAEFGAEILRYPIKNECNLDVHLEIIRFIEENKIDGLVVVPLYIYKFDELMRYAKDHSIPVAIINTGIENDGALFYYGPDDRQSGLMAGELISKFLGFRGEVCVVVRKQDVVYYTLRLQGFCSYIQKNCPLISLSDICTYEQDREKEALEKILCRPDLRGIYVMDGGGAGAFGAALKELRAENLTLVGHEHYPLSQAMLGEGYVTALLCEEKFCQGYYPVKLLFEYLVQGTQPAQKEIYSNINIIIKENGHYLDYRIDGRGYK